MPRVTLLSATHTHARTRTKTATQQLRQDLLDKSHYNNSLLLCTLYIVHPALLVTPVLLSLPLRPAERLAEGEFIKGVIENENAMRLIHYEPIKQ